MRLSASLTSGERDHDARSPSPWSSSCSCPRTQVTLVLTMGGDIICLPEVWSNTGLLSQGVRPTRQRCGLTRCRDKIRRIFHNFPFYVVRCWIISLPPTVAPGISVTGRTLNSTRLLPFKDFCTYKTKVNIGGGSGLHNDWRRGGGKFRMAQVRPVVFLQSSSPPIFSFFSASPPGLSHISPSSSSSSPYEFSSCFLFPSGLWRYVSPSLSSYELSSSLLDWICSTWMCFQVQVFVQSSSPPIFSSLLIPFLCFSRIVTHPGLNMQHVDGCFQVQVISGYVSRYK